MSKRNVYSKGYTGILVGDMNVGTIDDAIAIAAPVGAVVVSLDVDEAVVVLGINDTAAVDVVGSAVLIDELLLLLLLLLETTSCVVVVLGTVESLVLVCVVDPTGDFVFGINESTTPIGPSKSISDSGHVSSSGCIE